MGHEQRHDGHVSSFKHDLPIGNGGKMLGTCWENVGEMLGNTMLEEMAIV
jgi:hypothetical protein